jgi:hypothetical protein
MRLSGIILAALATLCVSLASAPAAKATVLGAPVASIDATGSIEPVSYYKRRYYDDCYRPYYGRYHKHKHGSYYRRSYRHKQYSDYDYPYRKQYRRHHRNDDDYDDYDD